jgi:hypothetical protein
MESALPGSTKLLLDQIRPVNGGSDHLWAFGSLDIEDKHNLIIPTVTVVSIKNIWAQSGTIRMESGNVRNNAAEYFVIMSMPKPITVQGNPQTSVDVAFRQGTPLNGLPVIPTLLDIRNLVSETLDALATLIGA